MLCRKFIRGFNSLKSVKVSEHYTRPSFCTSSSQEVPKNEQESWDVVVSGGGLVGSAMACALGISPLLSDHKILLLEGGPKVTRTNLSESFGNRVTSINSGSKEFLNDIGAWDKICNMRMRPVRKMQVWESCSNSVIIFDQPSATEYISYIIENNVILRALTECLDELKDSVTVWNGVRVVSYDLPSQSSSSQTVVIKLQDGKQLKTKLLIGADGFNSLVRKSMGSKYISWNYDQQAIIATLRFSEPIENYTAWQKFLPTGPIALLPLTDECSSLVWTVTPDMADGLMSMDDEDFTDALNSALWKDQIPDACVSSLTSVVDKVMSTIFPFAGSPVQLPPSILSVEAGSRATFPLGLGHSTKYVGPHVALIGDAAHRVHPLAGLGVNLGYGDAQTLSEKIADGIYNGNYTGFSRDLASYETERQRHNVPAMIAIDQLNRLYSNNLKPAILLRSIGLQLTNMCPPIKREIMKFASQ